jgi:uroporphyrinogen decarboxylase
MKDKVFKRLFPLLKDVNQARAPMIAGDHLAFLLDKPICDVVRDGSLLADGIKRAYDMYKPDMVIVFADIAVEAEALGVTLEFSANRNPHPIKLPDLKNVKVIDLSSAGRVPELLKAARLCRNTLGADYPIFYSMKDPFSLAALVMGSEEFLSALLEEPERIQPLLEICTENIINLIETVCKEDFFPLIGAPIASGSLIGPRWFDKFVEPVLKRVFDVVRSHGFPACMHICGEVSPFVDQLPRLNLDLLSVEEWVPELWDKMPDTIPMGYVPTELFVKGSKEAIESAVNKCLKTMPEPFLLSTACDLPANGNPELVKHFMTVGR